MTLHHTLHPKADVDRLYFKKSEGGRGLILMSVKDSINSDMNSRYVDSCNGPLLVAVYKEVVPRCYTKSCEAASLQQERKGGFQKKQLHGQFWRNTTEVRDKMTWGVAEKGQTKEGDGGYDYGTTRPSMKN